MTDSELLLAIAITTIITTLIQTIEMWLLVKSSRQTNYLLSHPGDLLLDGITGWIKNLWESDKDQKAFFTFMNILAQNMVLGIREAAAGAGIKPPKIRNVQDAIGYILSLPGTQKRIEGLMSGEAVEDVAKEAVKDAAKDYLKDWGL